MKLQIDLDIPQTVVDEHLLAELTATCKEEVILRLFAERRIGAAAAIQFLGLTHIQFLDLAKQRGIPYAAYTAGDFHEDMQDLNRFERDAGLTPSHCPQWAGLRHTPGGAH